MISPAERLAALPRAAAAAAALERLSPWARRHGVLDRLMDALPRTADPAAALINLEALIGAGWAPTGDLVEPLLGVCGASQALVSVLLTVPGVDAAWLDRALAERSVAAADHVEEIARAAGGGFGAAEMPAILRRHKRRHVLRIGARDLLRLATVEETVRELSSLADGTIEAAVRYARAQVARDYGGFAAEEVLRFVVLAMGKLGGGELNFSSDIDLVYLFDGGRTQSSGGARGAASGLAYATRIAEIVTRALSEVTGEGFVFRVDLRLRPDGQNGPIVNSLGAAMVYYESFGQTWERAAMLKARPAAGDVDLGESFLVEVRPFVYRRFLDFTTVEEIEEMKSRVARRHSRSRLDRDVKLGPGGIREVEFVAQTLQLVHGGRDQRLRVRSTLETLRALADLGLLEREDSAALSQAYLFLRDVEHKLQIVHERQTQVLPDDPEEQRLLARRLGYHLGAEAPSGGGAGELDRFRRDLERHRRTVRRSFENLFLGPRSEIHRATDERVVSLLQTLEDREASQQRLAEMGFADPAAAVENLLRLRDGPRFSPASARRRRALYALAPALLDAVRRASDPDQALHHMAEFIAAVGARTSFLALLEQNPETLRLLVGLFGASDYLSSFFLRHPELLDSLVRADLAVVRKDRAALDGGWAGLLASTQDYETQLDTLRRFHNEELLRIGVNDIHGLLDAAEVETDLSLLAEVCLGGALAIATAGLSERYGPVPGRFAVIGMGKLGRRALSYNSDLDLIFVYDGVRPASGELTVREYYTKLAQRLMVVLQLTTREGYVYRIDTRLRPSGSHGPLVSSLDAFREYHRTSSALWERQALISARGVAGDRGLIDEVEAVIEGFVYGRGIDAAGVAEIARLRARMERELARENPRRWDLKTGPGGVVDVEFVAEMLQLRHGAEHAAVRRRRTEDALDALRAEGLLDPERHRRLVDGYRFLRRVESRLRIERDQAVTSLDHADPKLAPLARRLGYESGDAVPRLLRDIGSTREGIREIYRSCFAADRGAR
ncbi:MAG: bifunctional [glutamate--ammonia ligase]-adenylyl-L-tyrosine phosphorylase/[glutamate--ammonia-ligase] adenylyltransferase [Deltaproteobacteria bacterium]|nr:bifunctional [glutamate--ammonia ligase]-adenylyl-L-tyrosine phosphorylase/[glutamate--ammonia-ligase] adenylyltransferase [Deltaproteobacteria bacterium]